MRHGVTKYALVFWTENHGWVFSCPHGVVSKDPLQAEHYSGPVTATKEAHLQDDLQDQHFQVVPVQITHEWSWPAGKLMKRN